MITAYHRPKTLDAALELLSRPNVFPLGGGTFLSHPSLYNPGSPAISSRVLPDFFEVVDLQGLGLDSVKKQGNNLELGAALPLQTLLEDAACPDAMKSALKIEAPLNIRSLATVAGTIMVADGRSTFTTILLACDAKLTLYQPKSQSMNLGDFLPLRSRGLITAITLPSQIKLAFESVSRTPADKPIVCIALAQWPSGRTRLAAGGFGKSPMLAMDGTEAEGLETAARNAFHEAADEWGSAAYRMDAAATLARRCLASISTN